MARFRRERDIPIDPLSSTQDPYVHLIAPNIDRISRATFRRGTVEGGRARRGLIVLLVLVGVAAIISVAGLLIATFT